MSKFKRILTKIIPKKPKTTNNDPESFTQKTKDHYEPEFIALQGIINRFDPAELIAMGCPEDEYDPETARIIARLTPRMTRKQVKKLIFEVFEKALGVHHAKMETNKQAYKSLIREVHQWNKKRPVCRTFCSEIK